MEKNKKQIQTIYFRKMTSIVKYFYLTAVIAWLAGHVSTTTIRMTTLFSICVSVQVLFSGCTSIVSNYGWSRNCISKQARIPQPKTIKILHANYVPCHILKVWNNKIYYVKLNNMTCLNMTIRNWVKIKLYWKLWTKKITWLELCISWSSTKKKKKWLLAVVVSLMSVFQTSAWAARTL